MSYADLEAAPAVLLAGFEPEEESPIVFLRLRKSTRLGKTAVCSLAPFATRGLDKLAGTLLPLRARRRGDRTSARSTRRSSPRWAARAR